MLRYLSLTICLLSPFAFAFAQRPTRKPAAPPVKTAPAPLGTLSIHAALVMQAGNVRPVARTAFYLLDADGFEIAVKSNPPLSAEEAARLDLTTEESKLDNIKRHAKLIFTYPDWTIHSEFDRTILNAFVPHQKANARTDFDGKLTFPAVPVGKYWVWGGTQVGKRYLIWNVPIEVKAGAQSIILDNHNLAPI